MARKKYNETTIKCPKCKNTIIINDTNCEKIADVIVMYCECGHEFQL